MSTARLVSGKLSRVKGRHVLINLLSTGSPGTIKYVTICPCTVEPCALTPGTNASMQIGFTTSQTLVYSFFLPLTHISLAEAATAATGSVHALLGPAKILFPLANPNGCTSTGGGLDCPLAVGPELTYIANLNIPSFAPTVRVNPMATVQSLQLITIYRRTY